MSWLVLYRFPILTAITWSLFFVLIVTKLYESRSLSFNRKDVRLEKRGSGTYGKFSFQVSLTSHSSDVFTRSYKTLAFSNGFIDYGNLQKASKIWAVVSICKSSKRNYELFSISDKRLGWFRIMLEMISYIISNYTLIICIPLVLTFIICSKENSSDYKYVTMQHHAIISKTYIFNALFIALIALY